MAIPGKELSSSTISKSRNFGEGAKKYETLYQYLLQAGGSLDSLPGSATEC